MSLLAIAFVVLFSTFNIMSTDASCCGCGCCCPCCCCKPIVIKLPPPPTKICPCCCCKPCCCCCCKPCCCPCCCGGGGQGRKKREIVNIAAKKFSDLFLSQNDAINMGSNTCNCNQCNQQQRNCLPCNGLPQFNFPLQQPSSNICGGASSNGCNNPGNSMGIVGVNNIPSFHQIGPNSLNGVGLNSFYPNNGAFGSNNLNSNQMFSGCNNDPSNLIDRCSNARNGGAPCADCSNNNGNNDCNGVNCNGNSNNFHQNDCMMYGNYGQFGSNGCKLRRRRRNTFFSEALPQRQKTQKKNSGSELKSNESANNVDSTANKRKKESKKNMKKRQRHSKLKPMLKQKGKRIEAPKNKANSNNAVNNH